MLGCGSWLQAQGGYAFASPAQVNGAPQSESVAVTLQRTGTVSSVKVVTQGISGLDFANANTGGSGACSVGSSYLAGQSCTVTVAFSPLYPGSRQGAVVLAQSDGQVLGTEYLYGTGVGPLAIMLPGILSTVAGNGAWIYNGDGGPAAEAPIYLPMGGAADAAGNVYFADSSNDRIRRIDAATGAISTVAGNGTAGFSGDGGLATSASVNAPSTVVLDGAGNLYIADTSSDAIRMVNAATGIITTIAGVGDKAGYSGDLGPGVAAHLTSPNGLALDAAGNLYIADTGNNAVRKLNLATGIIATVAGNGTAGYGGDGGSATSAMLNSPQGIALGGDGSLFIADFTNNRIRKVDAAGSISTVAGSGAPGFAGDGGSATAALLNIPAGVVVDVAGNIYVGDSGNNRVRKVSALTGSISTIAGFNAESMTGDGGPSTAASLYGPYGLFLDGPGNLYIADMFNNRIRKISSNSALLEYPVMRVGRVSAPQPEGLENDGNASLNLTALATVSNSALDPATTTCAVSVALSADQSCILGAEFAPTTVGNSITGTISVASNAANAPSILTLNGKVLSVDPTVATLTSSINPSAYGSSVTFSVLVTSTGLTPTGTIQFMDGTTQIGTATLSATATASFTLSTLAPGAHTITADYSGDVSNASAISNSIAQVVKQSTKLALASSGSPSVVYATVTYTATLSAPIGSPSGSIVFYDGPTALGNAALNGSGVAALSVVMSTATQHTITASYAGDASDLPSQSAPIQQVVSQIATTTTLAASNTTVPAGTPVTFTAAVANSAGVAPTGTVVFTDGATSIGTAVLDIHGSATLTTSSLLVGAHPITASYRGDGNNLISASTALTETIQQAATTMSLASSVNPSIAGSSVVFTATITGAAEAATGAITFKDGSTVLGTGALSGGKATFATSSLAVGPHSITATYPGDTQNLASASNTLAQTVQQATTSVVFGTSANPITAGLPLTLTASVKGNGGLPSGPISFKDGSAILASVATNGGIASYTTSALSVGPHALTAVYGGDSADGASTSTPIAQVVLLATTRTALVSTPNPSAQGGLVNFAVTVTGNGATPGGVVTLLDGVTAIGSSSLNAAGIASFSTSQLSPGSHTITASYAGDANDGNSISSPVTQRVLPMTPMILASSLNPAPARAAVVFTLAVTSGSSVATGTATFHDGAAILGSSALNASGVASLSINTLAVGAHSITATYSGDSNNAGNTSATLVETIQQATTQTTLASTASSLSYGASATLTATVTGNGGTPGGSVAFMDGATSLGSRTLSATGTASLPISTLGLGSHTLTAVYSGDTADTASTSSPTVITVLQASPSLSILSSSNPSVAGLPVGFTATLANAGGAPTGTVTWKDGATVLGSSAVGAAGTATFSATSLIVGQHTITATYSGDADNAAAASAPLAQVVQQATSTTALVSSGSPALFGKAVNLTATVTGTGNAPTGTVAFQDGATLLGSSPLGANGSATLADSTLSMGGHAIVAIYSGDANHAASRSAALSQQIQQSTAVSLASSANPAYAKSSVQFTASVKGAQNAQTTGVVTFQDGTSILGTGSVNGAGIATFSTATLSVGQHEITASYGGDSSSQASASSALVQTIQIASTSVTLASSANPAVSGTPITFSSSVTGQGGAPQGTITLMDGANALGMATLNSAGSAIYATSTLAPGLHAITAVYSGDANNVPSKSPVIEQSVLQNTVATLLSSQNPSPTLNPIIITATVANHGSQPPSGAVSFTDGGASLGSVPLDAGGHAVLALPSLAAGQHSILAAYSGDAQNFASTSVALMEMVQLRPTTTDLTASSTSLSGGQQVTLISVIRSNGPVAPTGTVAFSSGTQSLGSSPVDSTGVATVTIIPPSNTSSLIATYSGDSAYAGSASVPTPIVVTAAKEFTLSLSQNSIAVQTMQHSTVNLTLASVSGFSDMLSLGCLGLPKGTTCTFAKDQIALPANGSQTVSLTIDTATPLGAGAQASNSPAAGPSTGGASRPLVLACFLPGGLLLGLLGWKARGRMKPLACLLLLFVVAGLTFGLSGCGSLQVNGTPPGSYSFQVTAAAQSTGTVESQTMTMTVKQ